MTTITIAPGIQSRATRRPASGPVRLTRRGRLMVFLTALATVLLVAVVLASGSVATEDGGTPEPVRVVTVAPGQTLWDLAAEVSPDGDVRATVDRIEQLNALDSGMVVAGQRLAVPVD